jgi:hypothetical protein
MGICNGDNDLGVYNAENDLGIYNGDNNMGIYNGDNAMGVYNGDNDKSNNNSDRGDCPRNDNKCHNLSLKLVTKARVSKVTSQKGSLGVTFIAPRSAKECEGMNLHTPK